MISILVNPRERTRFLKFAVVGVIGAVVDFGIFNLLSGFFSVNEVVASVISFSVAVISNFLWNRFWTYPDSRSKPVVRQLLEFSIINVIGLIIRTPLFAFFAERLPKYFEASNYSGYLPLTPAFWGHNISLAIAVVVVMFWNFFINRYLTYSDVK
ncbi:MAG: GtrA family protein [Anaerolineales bacterium]|nr:GtrA family protein [Anaerolineales bacterium]